MQEYIVKGNTRKLSQEEATATGPRTWYIS